MKTIKPLSVLTFISFLILGGPALAEKVPMTKRILAASSLQRSYEGLRSFYRNYPGISPEQIQKQAENVADLACKLHHFGPVIRESVVTVDELNEKFEFLILSEISVGRWFRQKKYSFEKNGRLPLKHPWHYEYSNKGDVLPSQLTMLVTLTAVVAEAYCEICPEIVASTIGGGLLTYMLDIPLHIRNLLIYDTKRVGHHQMIHQGTIYDDARFRRIESDDIDRVPHLRFEDFDCEPAPVGFDHHEQVQGLSLEYGQLEDDLL